ncbi:MAG: hypothetical protein QOE14_2547 [Humisphaera sp.]|nr:hypothetical protein [Humisphaera sp.]
MPSRLLVLSLTAILTLGCSIAEVPSAEATSAPAQTPTVARAPVPPAEPEMKTAEPAAFATTQATAAPMLELEPAAAAPRAVEVASTNAAEAFDAQLLALIRNQPPVDPAVAGVSDEDRALLRGVIDSLTRFRMTLRSGNTLRQSKVAPLLELSEKIRADIPLSLPTLALCRSVQQFGIYDPIEPSRFTVGKETPVVVYCEVDHFRSTAAPDGRWETKLSYEAVLYSDGQSAVPVISKKPAQIVDRCRNRRRDFFLADRMTIPANLPAGKYVLKVTVIDQLANLVAEKSLAVSIAP